MNMKYKQNAPKMILALSFLAHSMVSHGVELKPQVTLASKEVSPEQKHWFQGSVTEAFAAAAKQQKHMILYWGAEWCPPCNDLKDQVFSHSEFPQFASRYIMVYLDGDSEGAQTWGEKLKVSGYPTVVLMDPKGTELFRFSSGMDFAEFKAAIGSAVASGKNVKSLISNLKSKQPKLSLEDWQTLATTYIDPGALGLDDQATEKLMEKSWRLCPSDFPVGKATFAAGLWDSSLQEKSTLKESFKANEDAILEQILASGLTMDAARNALMNEPQKKMESLRPENKERVRLRLVTYVKDLATSPARAPSERAMALHSYLDLESMAPSANVQNLRQESKQIMDSILQVTTSSHQMASTYPEVASIIEQLSGPKDAVAFLESKIPGAKTPWYFESMLSSLENTLGNKAKAKALEWSEKAKISSKGSATKLQWISKDVALKAKILEKSDTKIAATIAEFFTEATHQSDRFDGRNGSAHKRVASVIQDLGTNGAEARKKALAFCQKDKKCLSLYSASPKKL